jgi:hypothetical protein
VGGTGSALAPPTLLLQNWSVFVFVLVGWKEVESVEESRTWEKVKALERSLLGHGRK